MKFSLIIVALVLNMQSSDHDMGIGCVVEFNEKMRCNLHGSDVMKHRITGSFKVNSSVFFLLDGDTLQGFKPKVFNHLYKTKNSEK